VERESNEFAISTYPIYPNRQRTTLGLTAGRSRADLWSVVFLYICGAGVLTVTIIWLVLTYNGLVKSRNKVEEAWSGVDVQLKRRHDLVPNLVETVRGYAAHERETLERVTQAHAEAMTATRSQVEPAEAHLGSALGEIRALAEAYPELQATESFRRLQAELAATEDEIQAVRRIYNANVQDFNTRIQMFPNNLIAGRMSFTPRTFLEIDVVADRAVPQIAVG
jgi:LemA protein